MLVHDRVYETDLQIRDNVVIFRLAETEGAEVVLDNIGAFPDRLIFRSVEDLVFSSSPSYRVIDIDEIVYLADTFQIRSTVRDYSCTLRVKDFDVEVLLNPL